MRSADIRPERVTAAGTDEAYPITFMKNIKVVGISPRMPNIKEASSQRRNHFEVVELRYEAITWTYTNGNLIFKDGRNYF